jgi:hypothetical protein
MSNLVLCDWSPDLHSMYKFLMTWPPGTLPFRALPWIWTQDDLLLLLSFLTLFDDHVVLPLQGFSLVLMHFILPIFHMSKIIVQYYLTALPNLTRYYYYPSLHPWENNRSQAPYNLRLVNAEIFSPYSDCSINRPPSEKPAVIQTTPIV